MQDLLSKLARWMEEQRSQWMNQLHRHSDDEQTITLLSEDDKQHEGDTNAAPSCWSRLPNSIRSVRLPSFRRSSAQPRKLHATSYLDGLRGSAAFIVFLHHSTQAFLPSLRPGWASSPQAWNLLALPVVRIFYSGGAMVSVFFVISGYVLSVKPFQLAVKAWRQTQDQQKLLSVEQRQEKTDLSLAHANIANATFRRGPRLIIPCLVSTFLTAVLAMLGAFVEGGNIGLQRHYHRSETWTAQFMTWLEHSLMFMSPFAGVHPFEENTWTIPIEFKGSLMVFLTVMALAGRTQKMRRTCLCLGVVYWAWLGSWEFTQFLAGVTIAEWSTSRIPDDETAEDKAEDNAKRPLSRVVTSALVLFAVYLLSIPEQDEDVENSPSYIVLATTFTPPSWRDRFGPGRWWLTWGAILLVGTLDQAGPNSIFQRVFISSFAQFLGEISFSFYLLHGITIFAVGVRFMQLFTGIFGSESTVGYLVSLAMSAVVTIPFLFWISEIFTQVVDKGAVSLARRMMKKW